MRFFAKSALQSIAGCKNRRTFALSIRDDDSLIETQTRYSGISLGKRLV
jgi:hypothetical protein